MFSQQKHLEYLSTPIPGTMIPLKFLKENNSKLKILNPVKIPFKNEGDIDFILGIKGTIKAKSLLWEIRQMPG